MKYQLVVPIKKLDPTAVTPTQGSAYAAGYDLYAHIGGEPVQLWPGDARLIHIGLAAAIPQGFFGAIFPRSGLASKKGLRLSNCVGVIDPDYRGEIMVSLRNDSEEKQEVANGDRIAQLVLIPYASVYFDEKADLDDTARGEGGFGSTGE